ncbi:hypothetical protein Tco_1359390 [Tanacetum coccineum]
MDNSKRGYIPMQERLDLNKTQGASTPKEVEILKRQLEDQAKEAREWEVVAKGQQATAEERDRAAEERVNELEQQVKEISKMMKTLKPPPSPRPNARIGGYLLLSEAISYAHDILLSSSDSYIQQKIIVFAGAVVVQQKHEVEEGGSSITAVGSLSIGSTCLSENSTSKNGHINPRDCKAKIRTIF